ncbi:Acetyltransferase (GNAT) family protein [Planococcus massiliensis]|uniref:Acetyltransferase (GNAT) family protein n=1 Tax=Planococcus massiliensis TaxID=1499687 RepID=A0A098EG19_9BACL|nr:GNAT family N-acetyltransferase [Planococcus massiliensis]CEG21218.1 Acetyltransferase (GNAT) family protein [Planococcus massiliensis]
METAPLFNSERCFVRPFHADDLDDFMSYRNNSEWMKYQYFKGRTKKEYEEALLADSSMESGAQFAIIRKADQQLIGDVYLKKEADTFWIGYTVSPAFKRQGYATEIVRALIDWIRQQGDYSIRAGAAPENIASIRLLEKLGFSKVEANEVEVVYCQDSKAFGS